MAKEPMTENQKFAFVVFALVVVGIVAIVYMNIQGGILRMF